MSAAAFLVVTAAVAGAFAMGHYCGFTKAEAKVLDTVKNWGDYSAQDRVLVGYVVTVGEYYCNLRLCDQKRRAVFRDPSLAGADHNDKAVIKAAIEQSREDGAKAPYTHPFLNTGARDE